MEGGRMAIENMSREEAKELIKDEFREKVSDSGRFEFDAEKFKVAVADDTIMEIISDIADASVDIYTKDLIDWAADNLSNVAYVEDAISELGFPETAGRPDFYRAIMQGQQRYNEDILIEALEEIKKEIAAATQSEEAEGSAEGVKKDGEVQE